MLLSNPYWSSTFYIGKLRTPWASLEAQLVKNPRAMQETWVQSLVQKIPWRRERLPTPVFWPGEFHGMYSPRGCKEPDTTEHLLVSLSLSRTPLKFLFKTHVSQRQYIQQCAHWKHTTFNFVEVSFPQCLCLP